MRGEVTLILDAALQGVHDPTPCPDHLYAEAA
jgi:hypothetical protein